MVSKRPRSATEGDDSEWKPGTSSKRQNRTPTTKNRSSASKDVKVQPSRTRAGKSQTSNKKVESHDGGPGAQLAAQKPKKRTLKVRAEEAEKELEELKVQYNARGTRLAQMQTRSLAGTELGKDYIQSDQKVRDNIESLLGMVESWAADWALTGSLQQNLEQESVKDCINLLESSNHSMDGPILLPAAKEMFPYWSVGCRFTVETMVMYNVMDQILLKPFHFLSGTADEIPSMESLQAFRGRMNEESFDTRQWYSCSLRSFYQSAQYGGSIQDRIENDEFQYYRDRYYKNLMYYLIGPYAKIRHLLRMVDFDDLVEQETQLRDILNAAGKLSLQIWIQNCSLKTLHRPSSQIDLMSALDEGLCESRLPIELALEEKDGISIEAHLWLRLGIQMVRHERFASHAPKIVLSKPSFVVITRANLDMDEGSAETVLSTLESVTADADGLHPYPATAHPSDPSELVKLVPQEDARWSQTAQPPSRATRDVSGLTITQSARQLNVDQNATGQEQGEPDHGSPEDGTKDATPQVRHSSYCEETERTQTCLETSTAQNHDNARSSAFNPRSRTQARSDILSNNPDDVKSAIAEAARAIVSPPEKQRKEAGGSQNTSGRPTEMSIAPQLQPVVHKCAEPEPTLEARECGQRYLGRGNSESESIDLTVEDDDNRNKGNIPRIRITDKSFEKKCARSIH